MFINLKKYYNTTHTSNKQLRTEAEMGPERRSNRGNI